MAYAAIEQTETAHVSGLTDGPPVAPKSEAKATISVIGLGYTGARSLATYAMLGFQVIGVDSSSQIVDSLRFGRSPVFAPGLSDLVREGVQSGRISSTNNLAGAIVASDVTMLCDSPSSRSDNGFDLVNLLEAGRQIGEALRSKKRFHAIALRCIVPPGTTSGAFARSIEQASGKTAGVEFGIAFYPDFNPHGVSPSAPQKDRAIILGVTDQKTLELLQGVIETGKSGLHVTTIEVAEMAQHADRLRQATCALLANEVGRLCRSMNIDGSEVLKLSNCKMPALGEQRRPAAGIALGHAQLARDAGMLSRMASANGLQLPLIDSLVPSNQLQITGALELLKPFAGQRIGVLGITVDPTTDDIRQSPMIDLMAAITHQGDDVWFYDPNLRCGTKLRNEVGFLHKSAPRLSPVLDRLEQMAVSSANMLAKLCDVLIVAHATDEFRDIVQNRPRRVSVIDLVRLFDKVPDDPHYHGLSW